MHDIYLLDVVQFFLDGLKQRSKYAVCTADYEAPGRQTSADCSTVTSGVVLVQVRRRPCRGGTW